MKIAHLLTALILVSPAYAAERFALSGHEGDTPRSGTLTLDGDAARVEVGALVLEGQVRDGAARLQPVTGMRGVLQGQTPQDWTARITRDGPWVSVDLREAVRRGRRLELSGGIEIGARNAEHEALIERFYAAFKAGDGDGMAACYADEVHFSDPVFPNLHGEAAGDMWRMLCESAPQITFSGIRADDRWGVAQWTADYELIDGNPVHNVIEARFEFQDGKIVRHIDRFDFAVWARMAFGKVANWIPTGAMQFGIQRFLAVQLWHYRRD